MLQGRRAAILGMLFFAVSCRVDQPIDCIQSNRDFFSCAEDNLSMLERGRFDLCIPHSVPLRITGIWVADFEWNVFHEDDGHQPPNTGIGDYKRYLDVLPELRGSEAFSDLGLGDGSVIGRITFVGRRPLCSPIRDRPSIMVDRILSWEVLETGPSGSITYGPEAE
jgi:hypothetical protein